MLKKRFDRDQLVDKLIEDEKQYYDISEEDEWILRGEYERGLEKLSISEGTFECIGYEDADVYYDFGDDRIVGICGLGNVRFMYYEENPEKIIRNF